MKPWLIYEETAKRVVSDMRAELGVTEVSGKKKFLGIDGSACYTANKKDES